LRLLPRRSGRFGVAMDAFFSWRKTAARDLPDCLKLHPAKNGAEAVGESHAIRAWQQLFEMKHASRSALVEMQCGGQVEIVGFGFASFVKKSFVDNELLNPVPGLNSRIIKSVVNGNSVIASYEEVRDANTRGDLQQVILDTSWKNGGLTPGQVDEVRVLLGQAYHELFSGYNFSRILWECVDQLDLWHIDGHRSFKIASRFEAYRIANPDTRWNPDRALGLVTTETMHDDPHSVAAGLFHHHCQPQFAFTQTEQELLEVALEGADDTAASKSLFVTVAAIKHRWAGIFVRVAAIRPDLCPPDANGARGIQKRQRILAYVRTHPQELRPFNFSKQQKK
jgi:hypothetical protein